jgi:NADPH:quinone reductase-like Zn-dependent oxidoreductase
MKALIIYNQDSPIANSTIYLERGTLRLNNTDINYALIETESPVFHPDKYPDSVLIKKKAFSCNYRDMGIILHENRQLNSNYNNVAIGSEFSAEVIAIGNNVKHLKIGDRVIPNGEYPIRAPYQQLGGLPTNKGSMEIEIIHKRKLLKIPDSISDEIGAAFTIGAQTAYSMLNKLKIRPEKKVLLTGITSNTSLFVLNALINTGVKIYATARHLDLVKHKELEKYAKIFIVTDNVQNFMDVEGIHEHVSIYGKFDYVIDPFSDSNLFRLIDIIGMNGKYITCGTSNQFSTEMRTINSSNFFAKIILNNIYIMGNCLGNTQALKKAIQDYELKKYKIIINKVIKDDISAFMNETFVSKKEIGKVVYKY